MNSAIEGAHNLAWKLAAVLHDHAGDGLLDTYEAERRPLAHLTTSLSIPMLRARGPTSGRTLGIVLGAHYEHGALVPDGTARPPADDAIAEYTPCAAPGHRAPHVRLDDAQASSTLDLFGNGFVLLAPVPSCGKRHSTRVSIRASRCARGGCRGLTGRRHTASSGPALCSCILMVTSRRAGPPRLPCQPRSLRRPSEMSSVGALERSIRSRSSRRGNADHPRAFASRLPAGRSVHGSRPYRSVNHRSAHTKMTRYTMLDTPAAGTYPRHGRGSTAPDAAAASPARLHDRKRRGRTRPTAQPGRRATRTHQRGA
jgi:hypothetical protein